MLTGGGKSGAREIVTSGGESSARCTAASSARATGSSVPLDTIGAPRPSRRGVACSTRATTTGNAGATGSGTATSGASTGDCSAIAWTVRTGGTTVWADVSGRTASRAATAGNTSDCTGSRGGDSGAGEAVSGETSRCTDAPHSRDSPVRLRVACRTTGIAGVGVSSVRGRARSAMTPAGSSAPTRCPSGSR
ncbi:hypothetical protein [Amycolatopsis sp. MEPSY49]|uniref:hypothetical protein n=1 Tax=Amycolatopsis sp. MEPSY49 TaxID=3151600 RepID=UPI003EF624BE